MHFLKKSYKSSNFSRIDLIPYSVIFQHITKRLVEILFTMCQSKCSKKYSKDGHSFVSLMFFFLFTLRVTVTVESKVMSFTIQN